MLVIEEYATSCGVCQHVACAGDIILRNVNAKGVSVCQDCIMWCGLGTNRDWDVQYQDIMAEHAARLKSSRALVCTRI